MRAPTGLGNGGKALWKQIRELCEAAGDEEALIELDERELAVLELACRQADDLGRLQTAIKKNGAMALGSQGQPVVNPAITEARQARLAIGRLLGQLALPDGEEGGKATAASRRAQRAAAGRWKDGG